MQKDTPYFLRLIMSLLIDCQCTLYMAIIYCKLIKIIVYITHYSEKDLSRKKLPELLPQLLTFTVGKGFLCYLVNTSGKNTNTLRWLKVSEKFFQSQILDPLN
jgi:hypothetical protein